MLIDYFNHCETNNIPSSLITSMMSQIHLRFYCRWWWSHCPPSLPYFIPPKINTKQNTKQPKNQHNKKKKKENTKKQLTFYYPSLPLTYHFSHPAALLPSLLPSLPPSFPPSLPLLSLFLSPVLQPLPHPSPPLFSTMTQHFNQQIQWSRSTRRRQLWVVWLLYCAVTLRTRCTSM